MKKNLVLINEQNKLKDQMAGYRSLPEYILDVPGAMLQRLFNPETARARGTFLPLDASEQQEESFPSYWLTGAIIAIITFLVGWLISIANGYLPVGEELKLTLWSAFTGALALIVNKVNIRAFLNTFRESCVDKLLNPAHILELGKWLRGNFELWTPLLSGLIVGPLLGWFLYQTWLQNHVDAVFHIGTFVTIGLSCVQAVWVAYYLYPFYVAFPSRLNHYEFDLYTSNPSSSEVIGQLSRLLTFILYATMAYIVQLTIGLTYINVLTTDTPTPGIIFAIFVWAPTVILYAAGQFHLSSVITRAKWKAINAVQTTIENLYASEKIPDKELLAHLEQLMNYHDRIKSTPNSALDLRTGLNFLNSLILPILGFFFAWFSKK
jgi:hypothetical protein